ncbi:MAG: hypothetical protein JNL50_05200 [Phycisphaerae bacterium]|nr:hypothetical protein [Phycisphaerae bacterium]
MSDSRHVESLVKFLGPGAAPGNAFAVLALEKAAHPDAAVLRALNEQLALVSAHPHSSTPEGDEVRMILHTAAAQLMSKRRDAERAILTGGASDSGCGGGRGGGGGAPVAPVVLAEMQVIVARHGGMTRGASAELAALAEREGVELSELMAAFAAPANKDASEGERKEPRGLGITRLPREPSARPEELVRAVEIPADLDPAARTLKHAVLIAGVAIVLLLTMTGVIVAIVRSASGSGQGAVAAGDAAVEDAAPDRPREEFFPAPTPEERSAKEAAKMAAKDAGKPKDAGKTGAASGDAQALMHQLGTCLDEIGVDAGAATARFGDVLSRLAEKWDQLAPDQLLAAQDRIVEFVYRVGGARADAPALVAALGAMGDPSLSGAAISKRAFEAGVLSRLSRESDLPGAIAAMVGERMAGLGMSGAGASSFAVGARAALSRAAADLVRALGAGAPVAEGDDAWGAWMRLVDAVSGGDEEVRERLVSGALETLLIDLPEPMNAAGEGVARRLVAKLSWREESPARRRVLGWFGDPRITPEDLAIVTGAIAAGSAPGVDRTMILARDADPAQRDRLREVYEAAWGGAAAKPKDELVAQWIEAARQYVDSAESASTPGESLARAVVMSRLSEAAARIWIGEDAEPAEIIKAPESTVMNLLSGSGSGGGGTLSGDAGGEWALRYLSAKAQLSERLRLLGEAATRDSIGAADADVLMVEAIRGNPSSVRRAADAAVRRLAGTPQIVSAMLDQAYLLPKTSEVAELAEIVSGTTLPATRDVSWRVAVRRALVERLLQLLASGGDAGAIDALTERLGETYAARQVAASTDRLPPDAAAGAPIDALRKALSAWDRLARSLTASGREPLRLDQVERRAESRAKNAGGIVRRFAADQVTLAETMAYAVACERPARTVDVARVLDELSTRRRTSEHVMTQVRDTERAMLELWIIRMEGGR